MNRKGKGIEAADMTLPVRAPAASYVLPFRKALLLRESEGLSPRGGEVTARRIMRPYFLTGLYSLQTTFTIHIPIFTRDLGVWRDLNI